VDFTDAVTEVIGRLRPGEVVSYGDVAAEAGHPGASRAVGNLLRHSVGLPWWRVVAADGRLVPGHEARQAELLRAEGVRVRHGRVVHNRRDDPGTA
jgi:methylated-DNA-protein-cysteine methyltransferase-like protein